MDKLVSRKIDTTSTLACLGFIISWSLGPIFIKLLTGYTDVWLQNFLRYSVSCLFWLPFLLAGFHKNQIDSSLWRRALLPAAANICMQTLWAGAFYYIDPAFMSLIDKSNILWIAAFSLFLFPEERPLLKSKRFWLGSALSIAGVTGVLLFKEGFASHKTLTGAGLALLAAIFWSIYTISVKINFKNIDCRYAFSAISCFTTAGLLALAAVFSDITKCAALEPKAWLYIVVSSLFSIALSHVLYYAAIKRIGATIPALSLLATPFIVILFSFPIFGERLNVFQWLFGLVLLTGSALAIWSQEHVIKNTESGIEK